MLDDFRTLLGRRQAQRLSRPGGALVFAQGDPVTRLYQVVEGAVQLVRRGAQGGQIVLQRAGPGDVLAEASLHAARYHCAAEASEDAILRSHDAAALRQDIAADAALAAAYAAHLATEVQTARLRAEILSLRKVAERLDAWLAWHDGALPPKGLRHRLAAELGVAPEALYRELARRG